MKPSEAKKYETTTITVDILRETSAAVLVTDSATEAWLPKGLIDYDTDADAGDTGVDLTLPVWLAEKAGLV
ncbi:MAG: hypothetical protein LBN96_02225 [Desulfovibrio sp.]|nr:hypothetical protein [Desulfovibrio sp.]